MSKTITPLIEQKPDPRPPLVVALLGYGGLLPFVLLALASASGSDSRPLLQESLIAYGAVILSFVGALHWGFAMTLPELQGQQRARRYGWSVVPSLLAWPALMVDHNPTFSVGLLVLGFCSHYLQDARLASQVSLPSWYLPMRGRLTLLVTLSLLLSLISF